MTWGSKENCEQCKRAEWLLAEAREDFKVRFQPLTETTTVDADGIIRDIDTTETHDADPVNKLIGSMALTVAITFAVAFAAGFYTAAAVAAQMITEAK